MRARKRRKVALQEIRKAMDECFEPDFGGVDWKNDAAIQRMAFRVFTALRLAEETAS